MIYGVYAVRDWKTGFLSPVVDVNDASASRNFQFAVLRQDDNLFFTNPADYSLYRVADYDSESGAMISQDDYPKLVITAVEVVDTVDVRSAKRDGDVNA